ncbi:MULTISPECIES: hypothetical protein [Shouchella]|uniref:hypothetical protein n=1 Tax=Shouchella TaxID=2893057 RepID=UPI0015CA3C37|nr:MULTISPECIES: hypothetical protein [Shouchella]MCM3380935.1 hypothetical protein [Shouchella rhizosphaerae]
MKNFFKTITGYLFYNHHKTDDKIDGEKEEANKSSKITPEENGVDGGGGGE